ncbi:MAG: transcriptional regulator, partial [Rhizobiaceae bacterium]
MPFEDVDEQGFSFDRFALFPRRQSLLKDGVPIRVGGRVLDILASLVERHGEVISKSELMASVWVGVTVEESNLKVNMAALRKALGDDAGAARFIATVTGRGYRFIAPVTRIRAAEVATLQSAPAEPNHNLPITTGRVFGRSDTIRAIADDLGNSRLISVVGPGGIGKTTVALSVAETKMGDFPDGVWLVDLSPLSDQTLVASAIAAAIGMTTDSPKILATLCEHLRDRRMLIVLDSCEHVIGYAAQCAGAILSHAPHVRILATTREPLRVAGERVRRLTGLEYPVATDLDAAGANGFAAVQLFVDRTADHLETFSFGDAEAPVVAEICRRLDGHALAIELAAARVSTFGVRGILEQLDDRSSLSLAQRGGPPRQHTLAATIQWSYDLLPEVERTIMVRLSTLSGWFGLDAAGHIGADDELDRGQVLAGLASLVDKSLVTAELRGMDVEYRQWDTTRAFAQ